MSETVGHPGLLSRVWAWLRWPAAIGFLGYLVYYNVYLHADELLERGVRWWAIAAAAGCFATALLITYYRWYLLVWAQGFDFEYVDAIRLGLVGQLFNFIAPGSVGGDFVKGAMIAKEQQSRRLVAASTVFLDRCVGTLGLFLFGGLVYLLLPSWYRTGAMQILAILFAIGAAIGIVGLVVALTPAITNARWMQAMTHWQWVGGFLRGLLETVRLYQSRWRLVVMCVAISFVGQVFMLSTFWFCSQAIARGSAVPRYLPQLVFGAGSNFVQAFVPTPGGVGGFESAYAGGCLAADGLEVDHLEAIHRPGKTPPEYVEAFGQVLAAKQDGPLARLVAGKAERARTTSALTAIVDDPPLGTQAFDTGTKSVTPGMFWQAYKAGHGLMAFREGLLAALTFRVLTVIVALIGATLYVLSRREFDTAIERQEEAFAEHEDEQDEADRTTVAEASPMPGDR